MSNDVVSPPNHMTNNNYNSNLHLRFAIAISSGILVLISLLFLFSYCLLRLLRRNPSPNNPNQNDAASNNNTGIILPRAFFVAEGDESDDIENGVIGLDQEIINSYPKFPYLRKNNTGTESVCAICLCEYRENEMLRMLPDCRHFFHLSCVDAWLKLNASCPVCRNSPLPTPLSTPLSEVVPLSQYSDGRSRRR